MKNTNCMYDKYIENTVVKPLHRGGCLKPYIWPESINRPESENLHFKPVSILPYRIVLKTTHLCQVAGSGSVCVYSSTKGKPAEDVG